MALHDDTLHFHCDLATSGATLCETPRLAQGRRTTVALGAAITCRMDHTDARPPSLLLAATLAQPSSDN
eukprot:846022-Alexandrium_andersonii.AAC.1